MLLRGLTEDRLFGKKCIDNFLLVWYIYNLWACNGIDLLLWANGARRGWSAGLFKKRTEKSNAKLNRLSTVDFTFDMSDELAEVAA